MIILDGRIASHAIKDTLKTQVATLIAKGCRPPHLAVVIVGNDGASETYVNSKIKNCASIGFESTLIRLDKNTPEQQLLDIIATLNNNPSVDGFLVQLPVPKHIDTHTIIAAISPTKDIDGFHPLNVGKMVLGLDTFIPATPYGILLLLDHFKISTESKRIVILGRSNLVGRPLSILFSNNSRQGNGTVTLCHSHTSNLTDICLQADILIAALGKPWFVKEAMIKQGAVVIDVGITRTINSTSTIGKATYTLQGDVDYTNVAQKTAAITPVPGGVGLMTVAALMKNTYTAYLRNNDINE